MIHWLKRPTNEVVARYVECFWFIEKPMGSTTSSYPKLNPDPSGHLILSPPSQRYQYAHDIVPQDWNSEPLSGCGSHWLFPHCRTYQLDHSKPFSHLGIKFNVGALYGLNIGGTEPILDSVTPVEMAALIGLEQKEESSLIELARTDVDQCCYRLANVLLPWLDTVREDQHSELTRRALPLLATMPISSLGTQLHCSQRTLERSFSKVVGLTLKQFQAMNKLELMLAYLYERESADIDWVTVAYQFGFSDQPHLIRYLKKHIGLTPNHYVQQRDFTIDIYGSVEALSR
ncbi:helix-turn-helix domain-containing protein [Vibrio sp. E150_011]